MNIISLRFMRGCGCHYSSYGQSDVPEFSIAKHRVLVQTHFVINSIKDKRAYKKCSGIAGTPVGRTKCYECGHRNPVTESTVCTVTAEVYVLGFWESGRFQPLIVKLQCTASFHRSF